MIKARRTSITPIVAVNGDVTEAGIARISTRCVGELLGTVGAGNPTWRPARGTLPLSFRFARTEPAAYLRPVIAVPALAAAVIARAADSCL